MVLSTAVLLQVILVSLASVASAAPGEGSVKKPEPAVTVSDEPATTATTATPPPSLPPPLPPGREPKDVSILKQINKVNDDGSYTFGYEASDGSFKVETRDVAGNVKGMFGFVDEAGRLKRVSYSASNSSGFQAAGSTSSSPSPPVDASASASSTQPPAAVRSQHAATAAVKKVLVSKRPVSTGDETDRRRREGDDPRRLQLPRNDDGDAPDVYGGGVHGRSSMESGPVSPVVSALMSELELVPVRAYRPTAPAPPTPPTEQPGAEAGYDDRAAAAAYARQDTISRQAQEDDEPRYRPVRYRKQQPPAAAYLQLLQRQSAALPTVMYQQRPVVYPAVAAYGFDLAAFRDELMELILAFVQARVSQLVTLAPAPYGTAQPYGAAQPYAAAQPSSYPMPYQQPNYYVPSYYQGPRMPAPAAQPVGGGGLVLQPLRPAAGQPQDEYDVTAAAVDQRSSPKVTQALKDGLIRMLLSTSPRYDPDRNREWSTPSATFRRTTQSTPVRSVQILDDDADSRPVTTESPD